MRGVYVLGCPYMPSVPCRMNVTYLDMICSGKLLSLPLSLDFDGIHWQSSIYETSRPSAEGCCWGTQQSNKFGLSVWSFCFAQKYVMAEVPDGWNNIFHIAACYPESLASFSSGSWYLSSEYIRGMFMDNAWSMLCVRLYDSGLYTYIWKPHPNICNVKF